MFESNHNYSPLDHRLDGHALTTHTYHSIKVFDPYITTQTDGIHTISRHMDDETETNKTPKLVPY
jgi:hypothetical protein